MLVLERKEGESIIIENDDFTIEVMLSKDKKGRYKLCVDAPDEFDIFRKELLEEEWIYECSLLVFININFKIGWTTTNGRKQTPRKLMTLTNYS